MFSYNQNLFGFWRGYETYFQQFGENNIAVNVIFGINDGQ